MSVLGARAFARAAMCGATVLALAAGVAACGADSQGSASKSGNDLPRTIKLVVPGAAGGGGDVLARQLAKASKPFLKANIIVLNQPGAGGQTALQTCAGAKPDGGCVVHVSRSVITLNPYVSASRYKYSDVRGVFRVQIDPTYIAVPGDSSIKTIDDLIATAKQKKLDLVGGAVGSVEYVLVERLQKAAGFKVNYVPYEGGSTVGLDLAGGHEDVGIVNASDNLDLIKQGKLRLLAVARPKRAQAYPDVPTLAETGHDVGDLDQWRGFVVPKSVPASVVKELDGAFKQAIEEPSFKEYQASSGLLPGYAGPADLDALMKKQSTEAQQLFQQLGILKAS
jgi:tripartite-type tricarboxylate transporter receptor subunit TctC